MIPLYMFYHSILFLSNFMPPKYNKGLAFIFCYSFLGEWTQEEQTLFLEAISLYKKDWDRITEHVGLPESHSI